MFELGRVQKPVVSANQVLIKETLNVLFEKNLTKRQFIDGLRVAINTRKHQKSIGDSIMMKNYVLLTTSELFKDSIENMDMWRDDFLDLLETLVAESW